MENQDQRALPVERLWFIGVSPEETENYLAIANGIETHEESLIRFPHPMTDVQADTVMNAALLLTEHFCAVMPIYKFEFSDDGKVIGAYLTFWLSATQEEVTRAGINGIVDAYAETALTRFDDDYTRLAFFVGQLIRNVKFDDFPYDRKINSESTRVRRQAIERFAESQSLKGVFLNHIAVCQGFARALKTLCSRVGIECDMVVGSREDDDFMDHAWNIVILEGNPYYVDVCFSRIESRKNRDLERFPLLLDSDDLDHLGYKATFKSFVKVHHNIESRKYMYVSADATGYDICFSSSLAADLHRNDESKVQKLLHRY